MAKNKKRGYIGFLAVLLVLMAPWHTYAAYEQLGVAEDAAHVSGDVGVQSMCVRKDTSSTGIGANGDYVPCATNAAGAMYVTSDITGVVPGTGASSLGKAEDAAHGSGDTGVFVMGRRIDTVAASSTTSGDYEAFNMDASGRLWTNPGFIGIEDAAETAGGNLGMIGTVRRDTAASSAGATGDNATLNTDATGRVWANTELPDASSTPNSGTYAAPTAPDVWAFLMCKNGSTYDPCVSSGNYVEDAASAGAEQVIMAGGVRQDTLASNTTTDGDYTYNKYTAAGRLYVDSVVSAALPAGNNNIGDVDAIQSGTWTVQPGNTANTTPWLTTIAQGGNSAVVNGSGQLSITCANCSGSGASFVDDSALTVGTSSGAPIMGMLDAVSPDSVDEGDAGIIRMSANRVLFVQLRDAAGNERGLNIDASGQLAITVASIPSHAVTNAGTFVTQENGAALTALQLIDDIVGVEDVAETAAAGLARMGSVRRDTQASSAGTTGDNATVNTDALGNLWITGTYIEDAAETAGAQLLMAGSVRRDVIASSAGTTGDNATLNTNAYGAMWTSFRDPCSSEAKVFVPISQTTGTQLFTGTASNRTYVCSAHVFSATAQNIALVSGTGTVCATSTHAMIGGTTAATGWNLIANQGVVIGTGTAAVAKSTTDADNVCILMSSTGQLSGVISYVVAPN